MLLDFAGVFDGPDGYATTNRTLAKHLPKSGVSVRKIPVTVLRGVLRANYEGQDKGGPADVALFRVGAGYYGDVANLCTAIVPEPKRRVLWTVFEAVPWPHDHLRACAKADAVITSSQFCHDALAAGGVDSIVLPEPIEVPESTSDLDFIRTRPSGNAPVFRFGYIGQWIPRKGPRDLLRLFTEHFPPDSGAELVIKTSIPKDVPLRTVVGDLPSNVRVITDPIPELLMTEFYVGLDALVAPTHGEGFYRPALEAAFCGRPTIITAWGGHMDYLNDSNAFLVPYTLGPPPGHAEYTRRMQWANPDESALVEAMKACYYAPAEARRRGSEALKLREQYAAPRVTARVAKALEGLLNA